MCGQKKIKNKINKRIHKTLEINYNFPSKVYKKSKVRSIDLNIDLSIDVVPISVVTRFNVE